MHAEGVEALKAQLATRFRQLQAESGLSGTELERRTAHDRKNVSAIRNSGRLPTREVLRAYDRVFGSGTELADLGERIRAAQKAVRLTELTATAGMDRPGPDHAESDGEVTETDRRQVIELGTLSALALTTQERMDTAVAHTTLDELEADADEIARVYGSAPHTSLLPEVGGRWRQIRDILSGPLTPQVRPRVTALGGQFSYFLGRLAFNANDMRSARRFAGLAARYADEVGDPVLTLSIAALRSSIAYWRQDYGKALGLLQAVGQVSDPYMDARIAAYRARTFVALGDYQATHVELDRMERSAGTFAPRPGETPVGPAGVAMFRAGMAVALGDSGMAREWGPVAVEGYSERGGDFTIEEAQHAQMTMAFVHLTGGRDAEPEEAARIARGVLSASPEGPTHTVAARLRQCAGAFVPAQRRLPEVTTFIEEFRALPAGSVSE
ncbi:hypothetical protein MXD62_33780 [Frankia sp. Mgl5]|nr:hypothetical protein [Frankia sp. Mgl5]